VKVTSVLAVFFALLNFFFFVENTKIQFIPCPIPASKVSIQTNLRSLNHDCCLTVLKISRPNVSKYRYRDEGGYVLLTFPLKNTFCLFDVNNAT
jgi:hypothetical protein